MKNLLLALFVGLPCVSVAAIQVPEGSVKQESCGFTGRDVRQNVWKIEGNNPVNLVVKNKLSPVGKKVATGDALFYVNLVVERNEITYEASSDIVANGGGWTSTDYAIPRGKKLRYSGEFINKNSNEKFTLLEVNEGNTMYSFGAVKADGFLCSGMISQYKKDNQLDSDDHDVYQKEPMVRSVRAVPSSDDTIAVSFVRMDDISVTVAVKQVKGGQVTHQKELQLDVMSGVLQIEELKMAFSKVDKSTILIKSIEEPSNYSAWISRVKLKILKSMN